MKDFLAYAVAPTVALALAVGIALVAAWPKGTHKAPREPRDMRSLPRRWEDGPPYRRTPAVGSMGLDDEHAYRAGAIRLTPRPPAEFARCDDTGEHASTVMLPRVEGWHRPGIPGGAWIGGFCPRCEAPDDGPHYEGCPFYDPDEAALFTVALEGLEPVPVRARTLDPDVWRPYLTEAEFAESFPGVPYGQAGDGPHTGDLMPVSADLADQLDQLDRETADWLASRAAAHADIRARLILGWQTLRQHSG